MTLNKKLSKSTIKYFSYLIFLFIYHISFISFQSFAQENYKFNEMEINRNSNLGEDNSDFPTNPFEIVDRIRRANSLNEATKPSDAIDDAIKSFDMIKEEKQI